MKWLSFTLILLACSTTAFAVDLSPIVFVTCHDGDTCTVDIPHIPAIVGYHLPIRLRGIDAPEINGRCYSERSAAILARDYLNARLTAAKVVALANVTRDKYFRLDAIIFADGIDINQELLIKGYARPYTGGARLSWC